MTCAAAIAKFTSGAAGAAAQKQPAAELRRGAVGRSADSVLERIMEPAAGTVLDQGGYVGAGCSSRASYSSPTMPAI